jgi:hypothetical protein
MNIDELKKSLSEIPEAGKEYYWAGEKQLLVAILSSAMLDARKTGRVGREATQFFMNTDDNYIFSFRSICEYLKINPESILKVVSRNKEQSSTRSS